jgi:hypothetical protein
LTHRKPGADAARLRSAAAVAAITGQPVGSRLARKHGATRLSGARPPDSSVKANTALARGSVRASAWYRLGRSLALPNSAPYLGGAVLSYGPPRGDIDTLDQIREQLGITQELMREIEKKAVGFNA